MSNNVDEFTASFLDMRRAAKEAAQNVNLVFADAVTGKIRGYACVQRENMANQFVAPTEVAVEAVREPNLSVDKYIDLDTGEMYPEEPPA